ncbi:hypothetical protein [uncultured Piscinibacter sp.]|uniref:hypothetical protein n=1 Tax=uncultured Piscinibacter sp. TaxID=1131835 RepID=UPI002639D349|nr:hypothetical protein [uncultured Piscinibacter sp.]
MKTSFDHRDLSPEEMSAWREAARQRALDAREEAMRQFWAAAGRGLRDAWRALLRVRRPART